MTTVELLSAISASAPEVLEQRWRECLKQGHAWGTLDENPFGGELAAEYCGWCLRIRVPGFEGWIRPPVA